MLEGKIQHHCRRSEPLTKMYLTSSECWLLTWVKLGLGIVAVYTMWRSRFLRQTLYLNKRWFLQHDRKAYKLLGNFTILCFVLHFGKQGEDANADNTREAGLRNKRWVSFTKAEWYNPPPPKKNKEHVSRTKDKVATEKGWMCKTKAKYKSNENSRNIKTETNHRETRGMVLVGNTGWHHGRTWKELTKTWGRTKTTYWHTNKWIRYRWSEEGHVRHWMEGETQRGRNWKARRDTQGHNFTIKQETCSQQKTGSWHFVWNFKHCMSYMYDIQWVKKYTLITSQVI